MGGKAAAQGRLRIEPCSSPPTPALPPKGGGSKRLVGLLVALLLTGSAVAQPPDEPTPDPAVLPVQFTQPVGPATAAPPPAGVVTDPPTPVVRVQVRVPAHLAPNKDLAYKLVVSNTSPADAYKVTVRNPVPSGVAQVVSADPKPDKVDSAPGSAVPKELVWHIGTLRAGERREIELVLKPTADAKEVRDQAFVSFEHGQAVVTRIDKPKLAVTHLAPKQAAQSDPITVRVVVENKGRVPVAAVELVEDVTPGFEFASDGDAKKGARPEQRVWELGTLRPGERRAVEYKLTAKEARKLLATSVVRSPDHPEGERAESTTEVLTAGLTLDLTGPATAPGGEAAVYEIVARNTGTLTLTDLRVSGSVPSDCTLTKMTNGGQRYRDQVVWAIPQLKPGDAQSFRLGLKAGTTGKRTIRAAARDARGLEKARELVTTFQGTAVVQWTARLDPPTLSTNREGMLTIRVSNAGGEAARNVRLRVELPPEVRLVEASPRKQAAANEVAFDAVSVPANGEEKFTVTYRAEKAGQAWFRLKLTADVLGDQPLTKEQAVEITAGR